MDRTLIPLFLSRWWFENKSRSLRLMIVGGVFVTILGLAYRATQSILQLMILMLVGIGATLILLRWPGLGFLGLVIGSMVVPFGLSTGTQSSLNTTVLIMFLLVGLWLFSRVALKRKIIEIISRPYLALLIFAIIVLLAFGMGQLPWFVYARAAPLRSQISQVLVFLLSFLAFILVGQQLRDLRWLKALTWLFILLGAVYITARLFPPLRVITNRLYANNAGGSLFWTWLVAATVSQALFNRELRLRWRFLAGGIGLATLYVGFVVVRAWTSGWLPAAIAMIVILWFGIPRLGLIATIVGAILMVIQASSVSSAVMVGDNEYSLMTRVEAWRIILEIVKVNPVLGLGPANYYWYTPLFPILGYAVSFNSHNNYIDIIAQSGVLGLLCFLWFALETGRLAWRLFLRVPEGFPKSYVYMCLGGLAGTMVAAMLGDWVLPYVYNVGIGGMRASIFAWLFLGGLAILEHLYLTPRNGGSPVEKTNAAGLKGAEPA